MVFLKGGLLVTEDGAEEFAAASRRARFLDAGPA